MTTTASSRSKPAATSRTASRHREDKDDGANKVRWICYEYHHHPIPSKTVTMVLMALQQVTEMVEARVRISDGQVLSRRYIKGKLLGRVSLSLRGQQSRRTCLMPSAYILPSIHDDDDDDDQGGFAKCYWATCVETSQIYAMKVVSKESLQKSRARHKVWITALLWYYLSVSLLSNIGPTTVALGILMSSNFRQRSVSTGSWSINT